MSDPDDQQRPLSPPSDTSDSDPASLDDHGDTNSASASPSNGTVNQSATSQSYHTDADAVEYVVLNDDVLTSVANATMVLLDGSDLERLAVLFQFPQFLQHCPDDTLEIMVPEICRDAVRWKEEVQMAAAEALYFVVNMHIPENVAKRIVIAALRIIQMSESGDVFDAWGEILSMMLPQVKREDVLSLVVPATVDRASSPTVESRRLAARIIGSLNDALTAKELEEQFLGQAIKLCEDRDASVKAMIAQSLASVGSKLPLRISERQLWPKLSKLMNDENARVRAAAMRAVARSAEAHKAECLSCTAFETMLLPTFLRECAKASNVASSDLRTVDDDTYLMLEIFSEVYGYLLCAVHPLFANEETWTTALNALRRMVTCNGPTVRHWCAFNIPAVALVCGRDRPDKIKGVVQALSADTDVETRATLAAGIHETAKVLGSGQLRDEILSAISNLMTDQNAQVRMNSLAHFSELLTLLACGTSVDVTINGISSSISVHDDSLQLQSHSKTDLNPFTHDDNIENNRANNNHNNNSTLTTSLITLHSAPTTPPVNPNAKDSPARGLAPIFRSLETMLHGSWRTQELLAKQIDRCADKIPQDMLCEHVAPLLFQMARESTYLVRRASIAALVSVVRFIPDVRRRDHILKHFRSEWARGKVYWTRLAYIDGSTVALKLLSHRLFIQLFATELLSLARDPVANVRLRLTRLMPDVSIACGTKAIFKSTMEVLLQDKDIEIRTEALLAKDRIAQMPPKTPQQEENNRAKEIAEDRFFIRKKKNPRNNNAANNNNNSSSNRAHNNQNRANNNQNNIVNSLNQQASNKAGADPNNPQSTSAHHHPHHHHHHRQGSPNSIAPTSTTGTSMTSAQVGATTVSASDGHSISNGIINGSDSFLDGGDAADSEHSHNTSTISPPPMPPIVAQPGPLNRKTSFTNSNDPTIGAKPTIVVHSALGTPGGEGATTTNTSTSTADNVAEPGSGRVATSDSGSKLSTGENKMTQNKQAQQTQYQDEVEKRLKVLEDDMDGSKRGDEDVAEAKKKGGRAFGCCFS